MQPKATVALKGNLKSAECEKDLRDPETPAHKSVCNDNPASVQGLKQPDSAGHQISFCQWQTGLLLQLLLLAGWCHSSLELRLLASAPSVY